MYGFEQQIPQQASEMFTKALTVVYEDAKSKAPKLKNPKYGFFNKTNAAIYH